MASRPFSYTRVRLNRHLSPNPATEYQLRLWTLESGLCHRNPRHKAVKVAALDTCRMLRFTP